MQVHRIDNNMTFGKIILDCKDPVPANLLFQAEAKLNELKGVSINPFQFLGGNLLPKVIKSDYNTPGLWKKYQDLVKSQEDNPHDIHLDLFLYDENEIPLYPEGWYQKATVGDKIFKQRLYAFQGSAIKFLEDACKYANKLKKGIVEPELESEILSNQESELELIQDAPHKTTLSERLFALRFMLFGR